MDLTSAPVAAATPIVSVVQPGDAFREPGDAPGSWDSHRTYAAAATPGTGGPVLVPVGTDFAGAIDAAADRARSQRIGDGVFPAQAVVRDAATGAFLVTALSGDIRHGAGTTGAIDGWGYAPAGGTRLHDDVLAVVGGESWLDFRAGDVATRTPLPVG